MNDENKELTSFNKDFVNFDFKDVSIEELEQRLELAVAFLEIGMMRVCDNNSCDSLMCGGGFTCDGFLCATF